MNRPSFQFYPNDWTANPNLRRCTFAEKGIWIDVMCLLHDQPEYGIVRWPLKEIAEAVKCKPADLAALVRKGVLKGDDKRLTEAFVYVPRSGRVDGEPVTLIDTQDGPIWYSSRMVKDEYVRTIRGDKSRFGAPDGDAPKPPPKLSPKPPLGDGSSASASSSSSPSGKNQTPQRAESQEERPREVVTPLRAASEPPESPPKSPTRRGEIAALLRGLGVVCTYANPPVVEWAEAGLSDELLREAVSVARMRKPAPEPIPLAYLVPIVAETRRSPAHRKTDWRKVFGPDVTDEEIAELEAKEAASAQA